MKKLILKGISEILSDNELKNVVARSNASGYKGFFFFFEMRSNMKKKLFLLIAFLSLCSAIYSQKTTLSFTLNGKVENANLQQLILVYVDNGVEIQKAANIENGKFFISGDISEPVSAKLKLGDLSTASFWLEGGNIYLSFSPSEPDKLEIKGSNLNNQFNIIKNELSELWKMQDSIEYAWKSSVKRLETEKDSSRIESLRLEGERTEQALHSMIKKIQTYALYRFNSEPNSFYTIIALNQLFPMFYGRWISAEEGRQIYNKLSSNMQNTPTGRKVKQLIENYANTEEGNLAPDFTAEDIHGDTVKLSNFRYKKVVLLDGWASWCVPCIEKIPYFNELYRQYKDKGLVIMGVSMDNDIEQWKKAIAKYKTEDWIHILAEKEGHAWLKNGLSEDDILFKYPFIEMIPKYFLIDRNGIVIGHWRNYSEEIPQRIRQALEN